MASNNYEVFKNKDLSGVFKDIYSNQRDIQSKVAILIDMLKPLIKNAGDAAVIVPLIRDYLDVGVKNDSHLVRLAAIVQRLYATDKLAESSGGAGGILSEEEKTRLLLEVDKEIKLIGDETQNNRKQLKQSETETKELVSAKTESDDIEDEEYGV
jgi:hypothetical protein